MAETAGRRSTDGLRTRAKPGAASRPFRSAWEAAMASSSFRAASTWRVPSRCTSACSYFSWKDRARPSAARPRSGEFEPLDASVVRVGAARHVALGHHVVDDLQRPGRAHAELHRQFAQVARAPRANRRKTYPNEVPMSSNPAAARSASRASLNATKATFSSTPKSSGSEA